MNEATSQTQRSVTELFRDQVRIRAAGVALRHRGRTMSFAELDRRANRVAHHLLQNGLRDEAVVTLLLERSFAFVVAALGVLKAGGSYLCLDIDAPEKRLTKMLAVSGSEHLIAGSALQPRVPAAWRGHRLILGSSGSGPADAAESDPGIPPDPSRRAYLAFTSGSTGEPKAVEIEHHSLANLVCHYRERLQLNEYDRFTMLAQPTFDASVADLWPCLCAGGTVLIPPPDILNDVDDLIAWLAEDKATFTFVSTSVAEMMFKRPWPIRPTLRYLATGGDTLYVRPPAHLPFTVLNTYGPTENTVDSTWAVVSPEPATGQPAIGRPIAKVTAYVLDDAGMPAADGQEGELYLGGAQVARGYLGNPELTAERFPADPFSGVPGSRMYRTGDRVKWNAQGELEFFGRIDNQIQIRGMRVELGEIEAALRNHPEVAEACCLPLEDGHAVCGVVAHIVPRDKTADPSVQILADMTQEFPKYMVPHEVILHAGLPKNASGKTDRRRLAEISARSSAALPEEAAGSGLHQTLTRIWRQHFPAANPLRDDEDFWALGGDSLLAVRLIHAVQDQIGQRIPITSFLLEPTLGGLQRAVEKFLTRGADIVIPLRSGGTRRPLFCLYNIRGQVNEYLRLAEALGDDQPVYGICSPTVRDPSAVPESIEDAAAAIIRSIEATTSHPAPALVGYSWAGLLAFEVARQWLRTHDEQPFLCLIGTPPPLPQVTLGRRIAHFVRWFPEWSWKAVRERELWKQRLLRAPNVFRAMLALIDDRFETGKEIPDWAVDPLEQHHIALGYQYRPAVDQPILVDLIRERPEFRPAGHPFEPLNFDHHWDEGWSAWTGQPPQMHWIDSGHLDIMKPPHVYELAIRLRCAMNEFYATLPWTHPPKRAGALYSVMMSLYVFPVGIIGSTCSV